MGNFHRVRTDYRHEVLNPKNEFLAILSKHKDSKVKCGMFKIDDLTVIINLRCNYKPREFLKFILELDVKTSCLVSKIWFEDGKIATLGYDDLSSDAKKIPEHLK